jgi:hypothetical protein
MTILTGKFNWCGQLDKCYIIVGEVVLLMNNGGCWWQYQWVRPRWIPCVRSQYNYVTTSPGTIYVCIFKINLLPYTLTVTDVWKAKYVIKYDNVTDIFCLTMWDRHCGYWLMVEYRAAGGKQIQLGEELGPGPHCSTWTSHKSLRTEPHTAQGCQQCGTWQLQWIEICCINMQDSTSVPVSSILIQIH